MSAASDLSRLWHRGRGALRKAAREALVGCRDVADEGDRWFLSAVRGLGAGAQRAEQGVDTLGRAVVEQVLRLRPRWMRERAPRERIESLLRAEAKRLHFDVTQEQFRVFSQKIGILLELVYTGAVRLDDIAFEHADADEPSARAHVETNPETDVVSPQR